MIDAPQQYRIIFDIDHRCLEPHSGINGWYTKTQIISYISRYRRSLFIKIPR